MRRRDVGRHRQGKSFRLREKPAADPSRRSGLASRQARVDAALEPAPAGRGLEGFPPPGPWRDNRRATRPWRRPRPSRPNGRVRAQALKGSDRQRSRPEVRGQEPKAPRRGAVPDPPIRVRALPSDTVRANHPGRADTDTRPALPSGGSRGSRSLTVPTALPASPRGIWRAGFKAGEARMVGATGIEPVTLRV